MSDFEPVPTPVAANRASSGVLRHFADGVEVKISSHGAPWEDALALELDLLAPGEITDHRLDRTTVIQPLANYHDIAKRLVAPGRYDTSPKRSEGVIHIDPPGSPTSAYWTEPLLMLFLMPSELTFQRVLGELRRPASGFELTRISYVEDAQIRQIGLAMLAECQNGSSSGRLYGESLAIALAARLITCYSARYPQLTHAKGGLPAWRLRRVTDFIEENMDADLGLADLAAVAGFSEYHFSRMFKLSTGRTLHRYIMERRVARARELLARSQMPIGEISASLGFADQAHLTIVFKRFTGTTPKQFRERT